MNKFVSARVLRASTLSMMLIYPNWRLILEEEDVLLISQKIRENEGENKVLLLSSLNAHHSAVYGVHFAVLCSYFKVNAMEAVEYCERMIQRREVTLYSADRLFRLLTGEADGAVARRMVNQRIERERGLAQEMAYLCYRGMRHRVTPMQTYVLCQVYDVEFEEIAKILEHELLLSETLIGSERSR